MKKTSFILLVVLLASQYLSAGWSAQLQTESETLFRNRFELALEPKIKYNGKKNNLGWHVSLEWEIPLIPSADPGELELEGEFKLKRGLFSFGVQNELYLTLKDTLFSDEITLEPYFSFEKVKLGLDIEIDLLSKNDFTFDLELEPTLKYTFAEGKAGKFALEIEAPVLQLIKDSVKPSTILESADLWLIWSKKMSEQLSVEVLAGAGYNFGKNSGQYKLEPALKYKF